MSGSNLLNKKFRTVEWIPIEESLPVIPKEKYGIRVIVATYDPCFAEICNDPNKGYTITTMRYGSVKNRNGEWISDEFTNWDKEFDFMELCISNGIEGCCFIPTFEHITHWMYMPEPPEFKELPNV